MKTIILVGIPGAGKSSILQELMRQIPKMKIVNYGDKMLEEASSLGINREQLRKMPFKDQQQIGIQTARNIVQEPNEGMMIIDTHALIKTSTGFCPGLPVEVLHILTPSAYALVECLPQTIVERRRKDNTRLRDEETIEQLSMHQELTRSFLTACCMHTGSILCCIQNNHSSISENAQPLLHLIQSIIPKMI